jgi:glucose/arabinose dehydrogenase
MSERRSLVGRMIACFVVLTLGACTGSPQASDASPTASPPSIPLQIEVVQEGLSIPWDLAFAPDGRMFVTERRGRIQVYASGAPGAELLQTVDVPDVRAIGESGVMGVAVDREFDTYPFLYVCASRDADGEDGGAPWLNELLRFRVTEDDLEFEGPLFDSTIAANRQHNGCAVEMDESGHLWMTTGDALGRIPGLPQLDTLNGKVLRLNRDGSIPDDNPVTFDDEPGYVYSLGHRNPQGLAIEPDTGQVYNAEHGPTTNDEINHVEPGGNYGWPCYIASDVIPDEHGGHEALEIDCGPPEDYLPAAWASGDSTIATSGLTFVSGDAWGPWDGSLIAATLKESDLRRFVLDDAGRPQQAEVLLDGAYGRLRAIVLGPDGALYVTTSNAGNRSREGMTPGPEEFADVVIRIAPVGG